MIWVNPERVVLGSFVLGNVALVSVDREARRVVTEFTDLGRYAAFVDVPEQQVFVQIVRHLTESEDVAIKPGDKLSFSVRSAMGQSAAGIRKTTATVVVLSVEARMSARGRATQRIRMAAVSSDGSSDPVTITSAIGEV